MKLRYRSVIIPVNVSGDLISEQQIQRFESLLVGCVDVFVQCAAEIDGIHADEFTTKDSDAFL